MAWPGLVIAWPGLVIAWPGPAPYGPRAGPRAAATKNRGGSWRAEVHYPLQNLEPSQEVNTFLTRHIPCKQGGRILKIDLAVVEMFAREGVPDPCVF